MKSSSSIRVLLEQNQPLTHGRIVPLANALSWQVMNDHHITRTFVFLDFIDSMKFVTKLSELIDREEEYPDIWISYNTVRVDIWTHRIDGLTEKDFLFASKIDELLRS